MRALGLAERVSALGIPTLGFEIMNAAGRRLVYLDGRQAMYAAGAESVTLRRSATGRVAQFVRDLVLPFFVRFGLRTTRAMMRYRADLTPLDRSSL